MREHKYRVWDKDSQRMIYLPFVGITCDHSIGTKLIFGTDFHDDFWTGELKDFVLMQYIGRKDSKGTEVYEDDIIRGMADTLFIARVYWHETEFQWWITDDTNNPVTGIDFDLSFLRSYPSFEVIGNICEHSSLMEKAKEQE